MKFIKDLLKGFCIGAGAILPGISSGVLCVIFGIYDKLVESVLGIFSNFKKNFYYLLPIAIGTLLGIVLLGKLLKILFQSFPMQTQYAFIGLILGSIPLLLKQVNSKGIFKFNYIFYTLLTFFIGIILVILENNLFTSNSVNQLYCSNMPSIFSIVLLLISGFFMSIGIVVPGVSSTLILMCFGIYDIYLDAISNMNLSILIPLGIGVLIGGLIFLKIIKFLLNNYYMQTFYAIIGFTIGSVLILYVPLTFDLPGLISISLLIFGFYIAQLFEK